MESKDKDPAERMEPPIHKQIRQDIERFHTRIIAELEGMKKKHYQFMSVGDEVFNDAIDSAIEKIKNLK